MQRLDLPLDWFRYMLALIARDFDIHEHVHEFLRLRLVNRMLATEVLRTLQRPAFCQYKRKVRTLEPGPFFKQCTTSNCQSGKASVPMSSGYLDFYASFLLLRPHAQEPWNANISSLLNYVVDTLLLADGLEKNDETRVTVMRRLCHQVFEMKQWKAAQGAGCFTDSLFPRPPSKYAGESESPDFNVLLANVLLGWRANLAEQDIPKLMARKSIVFGTLLQVSIMSGNVEQVTSLLDTGVDVNDESLAILETAVTSDNPKMLDLILSRSVPPPARIERAIYRAVRTDKTEAVLFLARKCDVSTTTKEILFAFGWACAHNNPVMARALFDDLDAVKAYCASEDKLDWVLPTVIFFGHENMVRFLLDRGFVCEGTKMMYAAACGGRISMARYLLRECNISLTAKQWCKVLSEAVSHATPRYNAFAEAILTDPDIFSTQSETASSIFQGPPSDYAELLVEACKYGNTLVVRKMSEAGADLNCDYTSTSVTGPPVLIAHSHGHTAVADLLVEMGVKPVDPLQSKFKERFESGELPRFEKKKQVSSDDCYWWM